MLLCQLAAPDEALGLMPYVSWWPMIVRVTPGGVASNAKVCTHVGVAGSLLLFGS